MRRTASRANRGRPTGRFLLRVPPDLHARLRRDAARRSVSLNSLCTDILSSAYRVNHEAGNFGGAGAAGVEKARRVFGDELRGIVLFGSLARGEEREDSDIDLLIVVEDLVPITRALYRRWDASEPDEPSLSPHFVHLPSGRGIPGSLWIEVAIDGVIVFDPSGQTARALSRVRRAIAGSMEPRFAHGQRYWVQRRREGERAE